MGSLCAKNTNVKTINLRGALRTTTAQYARELD
jgi:hypothetical protein